MSTVTGRKLGKYELIERLGHGGMAEVYKAYQPGVERFVAIKMLHCHLIDSADFVARFQREARAVGRLQHPNIVRVIDFDREDDCYYMVMDFIADSTLSEHMKSARRLPVAETLRIGAQLADALTHAHAQQMVHRDIKPTNIMFIDAEHTQVVLTDFGLAQLCDSANPRLTMSGTLIGTPTYMSPEAVRGESCDARADIYSLGVVLYEMLTGKPPFAADTPYRMMMKQTNEPLPAPRDLNPALSVAVEELLLTALAKEPALRYQCAADFTTAIQQVQATLAEESVGLPASPVAAPEPSAPVTPVSVTASSSASPLLRGDEEHLTRRTEIIPPWLPPQIADDPKAQFVTPAPKPQRLAAAPIPPIVSPPTRAPWRLWLSLSIAAGSVILVAAATTLWLISF